MHKEENNRKQVLHQGNVGIWLLLIAGLSNCVQADSIENTKHSHMTKAKQYLLIGSQIVEHTL